MSCSSIDMSTLSKLNVKNSIYYYWSKLNEYGKICLIEKLFNKYKKSIEINENIETDYVIKNTTIFINKKILSKDGNVASKILNKIKRELKSHENSNGCNLGR